MARREIYADDLQSLAPRGAARSPAQSSVCADPDTRRHRIEPSPTRLDEDPARRNRHLKKSPKKPVSPPVVGGEPGNDRS